MPDPIHECARCKAPVKAFLMEGTDFSYWWFHCKKCNLKWSALKPPAQKPEAPSGRSSD